MTLNTTRIENQLLLVDPQNDFCDLPETWYGTSPNGGNRIAPSLPIAGAHADMRRLASFIDSQRTRINRITVTLDSHQRYDVAHPDFWRTGDGAKVAPFTPISAQQVRDGVYVPHDATAKERVLAYLDALESQGRYTLMVWPVHCEIGSWGHGIHADVLAACTIWQQERSSATQHVFKGMNPWTEHYSAIRAEVPDEQDPQTARNTRLLLELARAERLIIAGEASSHCVRATVEHIVQYLPQLTPSWKPSRLVLLTDCMSPVADFEQEHAAFLESMHTRGAQLAESTQLSL